MSLIAELLTDYISAHVKNPSFSNYLQELESKNLRRGLSYYDRAGDKLLIDGKELVNFSSNDYLNLATDERIQEAEKLAIDEYGAGSSASRLVSGSLKIHKELELQLANWLGHERVLVFGSGLHANMGVLTGLFSKGDQIFSDKLVHATLIDGARLTNADNYRFKT